MCIRDRVNNPLELKLNKLNIYTSKEIPKRTGQKYTFLSIFYAPAYRFFKSYILKGGFRDGKAGVINAGMDAFYKFVNNDPDQNGEKDTYALSAMGFNAVYLSLIHI